MSHCIWRNWLHYNSFKLHPRLIGWRSHVKIWNYFISRWILRGNFFIFKVLRNFVSAHCTAKRWYEWQKAIRGRKQTSWFHSIGLQGIRFFILLCQFDAFFFFLPSLCAALSNGRPSLTDHSYGVVVKTGWKKSPANVCKGFRLRFMFNLKSNRQLSMCASV